MSTRRRGGEPSTHAVGSGTARLLRDLDGADAWVLEVDGTQQSHVDLADPTRLSFDYMRRIGHLIDLLAEPGAPLDAVHLGGGGLTLPRYVAATRPRSIQRVFETDVALTALVRRRLPLQRSWRIRVGGADARDGLARLRPESTDLVVTDVYARAKIPPHLTSVEFVGEAARVLREGGVYALNVVDVPPLEFARGQVATVRTVFPAVAMIADSGVLRTRRLGNLVIAASRRPLPTKRLAERCAADASPCRVVAGQALTRFTGSVPAFSDRVPAARS